MKRESDFVPCFPISLLANTVESMVAQAVKLYKEKTVMNYKNGKWHHEKPEYRKFDRKYRGGEVEGGYVKNRRHYIRTKMGVSPYIPED